MSKLVRKAIEFDIKFRDFIFDDEVLMRGTFKPKSGFNKLNFQHTITILSHDLINVRERKIKFHFRLIMRPDIGEINFDGECILESPNQDKVHFAFKLMRSFIDNFLLKSSYYHAEEFMKEEDFLFPPANIILKGLKIR